MKERKKSWVHRGVFIERQLHTGYYQALCGGWLTADTLGGIKKLINDTLNNRSIIFNR